MSGGITSMRVALSKVLATILCQSLLVAPSYPQMDTARQSDDSRGAAPVVQDEQGRSCKSKEDFEMSSAGRCRIQLYLYDGSMMYGDLIAAADSALSVYVYKDFSYSASRPIVSGLRTIELRSISKVVVKGRSRILQGMIIGVLGGMIAGSVITRLIERPGTVGTRVGPAAYGGIGLIAGGAIGIFESGSDLELSKFDSDELGRLKTLIRHPDRAQR